MNHGLKKKRKVMMTLQADKNSNEINKKIPAPNLLEAGIFIE